MTVYENSAAARAAQIHAHARRGVWRSVLSWLGVTAHTRRADAEAALWGLGGEWEERTAAMLAPLEKQGWRVLHDRALPGWGRANLDHVLVPPNGAAVVVLDTKRWDIRRTTGLVNGRLHCGAEDRHAQVDKVGRYACRVAELVGMPREAVWPVLVVHGSRVLAQGFPTGRLETRTREWPGVVHVLGPGWLVPTLAAGPKGQDAARGVELAKRVARVLPRYQE